MASADLYLDKINFLAYLNQSNCAQCGVASCEDFIVAIKNGIKKPQSCPFLGKKLAYAFELALKMDNLLPEVPLLTHPRPNLVGLVEINKPGPESLVIISGNNHYTQQVLMNVLGTTTASFFVIFVNTDGNTVDMSMVYQTLTVERIHKAWKEAGIEAKVAKKEILIPGLASSLQKDIEKSTGWRVKVGPVCVAELPLFLFEIWS